MFPAARPSSRPFDLVRILAVLLLSGIIWEMETRAQRLFDGEGLSLLRRLGLTLLALVLAGGVWFPTAHFLYKPRLSDYFSESDEGLPPKARALAERHLELWTNDELRKRELAKMRGSNAEWDFMGRTFLVLALANMSLRDPGMQPRCLKAIDRIIKDTLAKERNGGVYYFLMRYAHDQAWVNMPAKKPRSMFVDGEIALMIGARRMIAEREDLKEPLRQRVEAMLAYMKKSPVLGGESYPNECWTFCNAVALAAIRIHDVLDGRDHSEFISAWLKSAREKLVDRRGNTGIIISEYTPGGTHMDGAEGSSIWMVAHCLSLLDEELARDQFVRARKELYRKTLGFGYCREWPESSAGAEDVDSGPIVPILEASAGSSGMAFLGAATFGDQEMLTGLLTSLDFGAFPVESGGRLKYCASNQVGDAVLLYAMTMGPLWKRVRQRAAGSRKP
jgi:Linalool dehydratase/isomerase